MKADTQNPSKELTNIGLKLGTRSFIAFSMFNDLWHLERKSFEEIREASQDLHTLSGSPSAGSIFLIEKNFSK